MCTQARPKPKVLCRYCTRYWTTPIVRNTLVKNTPVCRSPQLIKLFSPQYHTINTLQIGHATRSNYAAHQTECASEPSKSTKTDLHLLDLGTAGLYAEIFPRGGGGGGQIWGTDKRGGGSLCEVLHPPLARGREWHKGGANVPPHPLEYSPVQ